MYKILFYKKFISYKTNFCASMCIKLINYQAKYTAMHGQQNKLLLSRLLVSQSCPSNYNRLLWVRYASPFYTQHFRTPSNVSLNCSISMKWILPDSRLPQRRKGILRSAGILRGSERQFVTEVLAQNHRYHLQVPCLLRLLDPWR